MTLPTISGSFRVVREPELKFTPSGKPALRLGLVASKRRKDDNDQWVDDKVLFLDTTIWGQEAENLINSGLTKGTLVVVTGALYTDQWEDNDGNKRSATKLQCYEIGLSTKYDTYSKQEVQRSQSSDQWSQQPQGNPWNSGQQSGNFNSGEDAPF